MTDNEHVMRVQIPAYTDAWMKGDRYGNVVKVTRGWGHVPNGTGGWTAVRNGPEIADVLLDKSNKTVRVLLSDCEVIDYGMDEERRKHP